MILDSVFSRKVTEALEVTRKAGYYLEPYRGYYSARSQAALWKKSRSDAEIEETIRTIEKEGAPTVAKLLREVRVPKGRKETDLLPGQSWHQYGEALDVRLLGSDKRVIWASGHHGYEIFARNAQDCGLIAGYFWRKKDSNHVQLRDITVRSILSWAEIDERVKRELEAAKPTT